MQTEDTGFDPLGRTACIGAFNYNPYFNSETHRDIYLRKEVGLQSARLGISVLGYKYNQPSPHSQAEYTFHILASSLLHRQVLVERGQNLNIV